MKAGFSLPVWLFAIITVSFLLLCNAVTLIAPTAVAPLIELVASSPTPVPTLQPTPNIKCPNGDCSNICMSKLTTIVSNQTSSPAPVTANQHSLQINATVLVTYSISGNQLGSPNFALNTPANLASNQKDLVTQKKVWDYFTSIIPADQRKELVYYIVATDGRGGMLAAVQQSSNHPEDWALNVDILDAGNPRDLTFTLIHEFGHLLTLNAAQVAPDMNFLANPTDPQVYQQAVNNCPQFFTTVGCSQSYSYINEFFQVFWPKIFSEWSQIDAVTDQNTRYSRLIHFYQSHPTQFVSPYASVSPEEDIAESWAHFVLTPKPPPDSIAEKKVLFFYRFPELVQLRNQILYGICNYASGQ
jgi:hypothetical protein